MDFSFSQQCEELRQSLLSFMEDSVYPAEPRVEAEIAELGGAEATPVLRELKVEARAAACGTCSSPRTEWGAGLTNVDYAPLAEIMGRSIELAPEATNCAAPDTGNMEVLAEFGTPEQQERWLVPLLDGEIRSLLRDDRAGGGSAPTRATSRRRIDRDGDEYVINGRKWWTTGAGSDVQDRHLHGQ